MHAMSYVFPYTVIVIIVGLSEGSVGVTKELKKHAFQNIIVLKHSRKKTFF